MRVRVGVGVVERYGDLRVRGSRRHLHRRRAAAEEGGSPGVGGSRGVEGGKRGCAWVR
jgi:hypothetical protein